MKQQLIEGKDFYFDENGYIVFTDEYLLQNGECCGNGCRHCPYDYENIPEPKRQELIQSKNNFENKK